jgi:hypothetical protein
VEQATAPTTAAPQLADFQHATELVCRILPLLEQQPFAVELEEDWPSGRPGRRVHLKFRETRGAGLLELAALLDVAVTTTETAFGVHLDAIARIEDVEVRGSALLSPPEAARLKASAAPAPAPKAPAQAAARPVPLGSSVLAALPAIVSAPIAPAAESEDGDEATCVRCGCTENTACPGGCSWVPNAWMVDLCSACVSLEELGTLTTYPPVAAAGAEAER